MSSKPLIGVAVTLIAFDALAAPAAAQSTANQPAVDAVSAVSAARLIAELDVPLHSTVAPSPDGRFLLALQTRPDPVLWIVPADGGEPFAFRKSWAAYQPRWAPSGNRIGFIAGIGPPRIWTVEMDSVSGRPIDPPRLLHRTGASAFAFSPDGERIALAETRSTAAGASEILIIDWESRKVHRLLRGDGMIYRLDWAPDGASIFYAIAPTESADSSHRVVMARVRDGRKTIVLETRGLIGLSPDGDYFLLRTDGSNPTADELLEIVRTDGERIAVVDLAPNFGNVVWAGDARSLIQVRPAGHGGAVWEIPLHLAPDTLIE